MEFGRNLTLDEAMSLAIAEARKGFGFVSPNPAVGCAILNNKSKLIGLGHHQKVGGPHAEIEAINSVKDKSELQGATMVVTLEPCAHQGRTPPCADRIAKLPIAKLVYGQKDPNPLVNGKGLALLKEAGIKITAAKKHELELRELTEVFFCNVQQKRTFIGLKVAATLDGMIALRSGESQWITSEQARHFGHYLRGCYDGILVGAKTALTDNPKLNVRHEKFKKKKNKVIIADFDFSLRDHHGRLDLFDHHGDEDVFIFIDSKNKSLKHSWPSEQVCFVDMSGETKLVQEMGRLLHSQCGVHSVLVEGGARTYSTFFKSALVDRIYLFYSNSILGGDQGLGWSSHFGSKSLDQRWVIDEKQWIPLGDNFLVTGRVKSPRPS